MRDEPQLNLDRDRAVAIASTFHICRAKSTVKHLREGGCKCQRKMYILFFLGFDFICFRI